MKASNTLLTEKTESMWHSMENTIFQIIRIVTKDGNEIITYEYNTQLEAIRGVQKHIRAMMELDKRDKFDMPNKYGKRFKLDEKEQKILGGIQFQAEAALKEAGNWINPIDGDKFVLNGCSQSNLSQKFQYIHYDDCDNNSCHLFYHFKTDFRNK